MRLTISDQGYKDGNGEQGGKGETETKKSTSRDIIKLGRMRKVEKE
jgi:hypothetical protein